jgi:hypothetical protein
MTTMASSSSAADACEGAVLYVARATDRRCSARVLTSSIASAASSAASPSARARNAQSVLSAGASPRCTNSPSAAVRSLRSFEPSRAASERFHEGGGIGGASGFSTRGRSRSASPRPPARNITAAATTPTPGSVAHSVRVKSCRLSVRALHRTSGSKAVEWSRRAGTAISRCGVQAKSHSAHASKSAAQTSSHAVGRETANRAAGVMEATRTVILSDGKH